MVGDEAAQERADHPRQNLARANHQADDGCDMLSKRRLRRYGRHNKWRGAGR